MNAALRRDSALDAPRQPASAELSPWLIGQNVSKGCIRMLDPDVIELFDAVKIGTKVTVVRGSLVSGEQIARERKRREKPDG